MVIKKCNLCGKVFDETDICNNFHINSVMGYGSKYDGDKLSLDFCCDCTNNFVDELVKNCKINPIIKNGYYC